MDMYLFVCVCMYVFICVCMYVCVYVIKNSYVKAMPDLYKLSDCCYCKTASL